MYASFFRLKQEPFSIAPDPRYLFMSERHREALAHLLYGVGGGGGFVLLTGEIGAGKTTVCRCFLEQIPRRCNVAYIFNPKLTVTELLKTVCDEFRIPVEHQGPGVATVKDYIDPLNEFLLRTHGVGQNNVLIIDEAQNLSADVLEQLRLLTNLETSERKLLQIILIGQPELRAMLARPELEQLAQRVVARFHLDALSESETIEYIGHRLAVAGMNGAAPFDRTEMLRIHRLARGVPRRINLLCDRAMLGAYALGTSHVTREIVEKAAAEVFGGVQDQAQPVPGRERAKVLGAGLLAGAALAGAVAFAVTRGPAAPQLRAAAAGAAASAGAGAGPRAAAASSPAAAPAASTSGTARSAAPGSAGAAASAVVPGAQGGWQVADLQLPAFAFGRSAAQAWRELAGAWGVAAGEGDACQAAERRQVQCFRATSGLALIRQLNRPGLLTLRDEAGKPVYAMLTGLGDQAASLRIDGAVRSVPLGALAKAWRGEFATFWRAPPAYSSVLSEGATGPAVDVLAAQIAKVDGEAAPPEGQAFDAALRSKVYAFQVAQGLRPDGIAGPTTFMQLNRATGVDEPRLQAP